MMVLLKHKSCWKLSCEASLLTRHLMHPIWHDDDVTWQVKVIMVSFCLRLARGQLAYRKRHQSSDVPSASDRSEFPHHLRGKYSGRSIRSESDTEWDKESVWPGRFDLPHAVKVNIRAGSLRIVSNINDNRIALADLQRRSRQHKIDTENSSLNSVSCYTFLVQTRCANIFISKLLYRVHYTCLSHSPPSSFHKLCKYRC